MPELPEVETIVRGLKASITGHKVLNLTLSGKKMRASPPDNLAELVTNKQIIDVYRRAKYILIHLKNSYNIVIHLGMSGKVLVSQTLKQCKHNHAIFKLASGQFMVFNDPRRFGLITYIHNDDLRNDKLFKNLGVEPLADEFNGASLHKICLRRTCNIKALLMNANIVAGIGNIYASESLFRAGIHPLTPADTITKKQAETLSLKIKEVLHDAIEAGGSTLRDYAHSSGDIGYFQHKFSVYGKSGNLCKNCASTIEKIVIANRSTYFCPNCQK